MDGLNSPFSACLSSIHGNSKKKGLRKSSSAESLTDSLSLKRDNDQKSVLLMSNSQWLAFIESMPFSLVPRSRSMSDSSLQKLGAGSSTENKDEQGPPQKNASTMPQPSGTINLHQATILEELNDCDSSVRPIASPVSSSAYFTSSSRNSSTVSLPYTHSRNSSTTSSGYGVLREEDMSFMTELPCTTQPVNSSAAETMPHDTSASNSNRNSLEITMCDPTVVAISAISTTTGTLTPAQQKKLTPVNAGGRHSKDTSGLSLVTMKSNEWIRKQMDTFKDSMVQVKVSSKNKHVVHFNVKSGDIIVWKFATKKRDIGFGVLFEATAVEIEQSHPPNEQTDKMIPILPILRVPANTHPIQGSHVAVADGLYVIAWDNSYSRIFAKDLFYCIYTEPADSASSQPNNVCQ